jgi:dinuclear metal center YbgI/SA1388 family protein
MDGRIWVGVVGVEGGRWVLGGGRWTGGGGGMGRKKGGGWGRVSFRGGVIYKVGMRAQELARECDQILKTKKFRDYPGAKNGLQVSHGRQVKKIGWAVDADLESIRKAGKEKVDFLVVHHGLFWGSSALDRKMRAGRIRLAKRLGVAIYSSHLPLDAHPELGNSIGLLKALGLGDSKRKQFGIAMGRAIGWKVEGVKIRISDLVKRVALLRSGHAGRLGSFAGLECSTLLRSRPQRSRGESFEGLASSVKVIEGGPKICRKLGVVTGGFGDLDQVVKAGLDTLITGEVDYPTEVKARELGLNLILGGHRETEVFGVRALGKALKRQKI